MFGNLKAFENKNLHPVLTGPLSFRMQGVFVALLVSFPLWILIKTNNVQTSFKCTTVLNKL